MLNLGRRWQAWSSGESRDHRVSVNSLCPVVTEQKLRLPIDLMKNLVDLILHQRSLPSGATSAASADRPSILLTLFPKSRMRRPARSPRCRGRRRHDGTGY